MYKLMTPGPTQVSETVRLARSKECTNPDLDEAFVEFYKETCLLISELLNTKKEAFILSGEGILGLEAACASLTEPGDKILVLDNGIYGKGFAEFVTLYGGNPEILSFDPTKEIDVFKLEAFLEKKHDYKYATMVHCDTPSGVLNPIQNICPVLKKYGILTVVDSVSGMFGEEVRADDWQIDVLLGGSQKALSAPPGLTFVVVSDAAKKAMHQRKNPIASFYANLTIFDHYYETKWFPYTMPISDIYGLRAALELQKNDKEVLKRHAAIGNATRKAIQSAGLKLHLTNGFSNTVTVFNVPTPISAEQILTIMRDQYNIMLSGSLGELKGKVIRIGHMGANATYENMIETLHGLRGTLEQLKFNVEENPEEVFRIEYTRYRDAEPK